ncbi:MAG: 3-phosphoserine/phosphohydroxythreonine transaminase [Bacteroidales bacterium]|nr:3-phosphoserine/phosphohydroxythreonine transaminase [Bacteroidales bacterium]MBN2697234.1 3-phosphoserine/phosphohydroxythreonine transaminase [Bacteroidales bacterium]
MKKHNFYAGPSILSDYTVENTAKGVLDFNGTGLSIMEISHRSKEFIAVMDEAHSLFVELLGIPSGYSVLFLHGGASLQFCMVPYNLLNKKAAYLDSGSWASKAIKEAKLFGEVDVVASSKESTYNYIPKEYKIPADADYFHITTNNTIYGTEIKEDIDCPVNLVADMSSDIFSRPVDISKYALIYGGAQKNLAPAGVAFVIIRDEILGKVDRAIPTMLNYRTHIENESMFNTPPVIAVFAALQTLRWYRDLGGLSVIHKKNQEKADLLYDEIDRNKMFVPTVKEAGDRSIMNVTFVMAEAYKNLEAEFLSFATAKGMIGIKGHRSVGGFRASIYNAMELSSVQALVDAMKEFESKHS